MNSVRYPIVVAVPCVPTVAEQLAPALAPKPARVRASARWDSPIAAYAEAVVAAVEPELVDSAEPNSDSEPWDCSAARLARDSVDYSALAVAAVAFDCVAAVAGLAAPAVELAVRRAPVARLKRLA